MFSPDYEGIEVRELLSSLHKFYLFSPDYEGIEALMRYVFDAKELESFLPTMRELKLTYDKIAKILVKVFSRL